MSSYEKIIQYLSRKDKTSGSSNRSQFKGIQNQFDGLNGNTPVPNQILNIERNNNNQACCIRFSPSAYYKINYMQKNFIEQQAKFRADKKWKDRPVVMACTGYKEANGDYCITDIVIPLHDILYEKGLRDVALVEEMAKTNDQSILSQAHLEAQGIVYEYLRNKKPLDKEYQSRFAMLAYTRPCLSESEYKNCMKLSEINKSIFPQTVKCTQPITSGTMLITTDSLECVTIDYTRSKDDKVTPCGIYNVTRAEAIYEDHEEKLKISQSDQPTGSFSAPQII